MMTPRQSEALKFIAEYQRDKGGVSPSFREIANGLSIKSKGHAHKLLRGLEDRGFIRRIPHRERAIEIVRNPIAGVRSAWFRFDDEIKELVPAKLRC